MIELTHTALYSSSVQLYISKGKYENDLYLFTSHTHTHTETRHAMTGYWKSLSPHIKKHTQSVLYGSLGNEPHMVCFSWSSWQMPHYTTLGMQSNFSHDFWDLKYFSLCSPSVASSHSPFLPTFLLAFSVAPLLAYSLITSLSLPCLSCFPVLTWTRAVL